MAAPSSLAHTLHLIHHINDETIVYLDIDLAKHDDSTGPTQKCLTLINKLDKALYLFPCCSVFRIMFSKLQRREKLQLRAIPIMIKRELTSSTR